MTSDLLRDVGDYYSRKLAEFGETPRGVDWNGEASQQLRFVQLTKVIQTDHGFSLNDFGCGYGALFEYLDSHYHGISYTGCDISAKMVEAATKRLAQKSNARLFQGAVPPDAADYGVASGIFNVRLGRSDEEWRKYVEETLDVLNRTSRLGFAFNCLTVWSDEDRKRDYLYYADPASLFNFCKRRYSRHVALLHDYGLYEFTIVVRRQP